MTHCADIAHPGLYDEATDPRLPQLRTYASADCNDPKWHAAQLRGLARLFPVSRITRAIEEDGDSERVQSVIFPYAQELHRQYLASIGVDNLALPEIPNVTQLTYSIVNLSDPLTMEHTGFTGFLNGAFTQLDAQRGFFSNEDVEMARLVGLLHDVAKGDVVSFLLESPFDRSLLAALYAANMGDPARLGHSVAVPFPLSPEEAVYFGPLIRGETVDPALVQAFGELCRTRKGDYRVVPSAIFVRVGKMLLKTGRFPEDVQNFIDAFLDEKELSDLNYVLGVIRSQAAEYAEANTILGRHGVHRYRDSVLSVFQTHVPSAMCVLDPKTADIVRFHHGFDGKRQGLTVQNASFTDRDRHMVWNLIIADVIAALSQARPYFVNGKPKSLQTLRNILMGEARRYSIPPEVMERVVNEYLPQYDAVDSLPHIVAHLQRKLTA